MKIDPNVRPKTVDAVRKALTSSTIIPSWMMHLAIFDQVCREVAETAIQASALEIYIAGSVNALETAADALDQLSKDDDTLDSPSRLLRDIAAVVRMGPAASCFYCVGAGVVNDLEGERPCYCQIAHIETIPAKETE